MKLLAPLILVGSGVLFLVFAYYCWEELPNRMAGHFDGSGTPTGRMPKSEFMIGMGITAMSIPLFLTILLYLIRFLPPKLLNSPHPEYWQKPENFKRACEILLRSSFWFSACFVFWAAGLLGLVTAANRAQPPRLDLTAMLFLTGFLIVASIIWTIYLTRIFTKKPPALSGP